MTVQTDPRMSPIPGWVQDAIFYQIFPDRFADGDTQNDPPRVAPWGSKPNFVDHMGGDLRGIIERFDYLLDLGINAIYLNPIFWASSNHKYNPYDYYRIDPRFGNLSVFKELIGVAHRNGVSIVLDGVFNHCGRGFFPFVDVMENRDRSAYVDWFLIARHPVDAYGQHQYATYGTSRRMPKLNLCNPDTRRYFLEVARYWIEQGADGWRLDAATHVEDHDFWREFRSVVKQANPEAYIFGEIWEDGRPWLQGDEFDGTTNYPLRGSLLDFFISESVRAREFARRLDDLLNRNGAMPVEGMYNLLGSHDTPRILTLAGGDVQRVKLAILCQFTLPGAPAIYYGDEVGMQGGEDPENRGAMLWNPSDWNTDLRSFYRRIIEIRKKLSCLRRGSWEVVEADEGANTYAFLRRIADECALVLVNNGSHPAQFCIPTHVWGLPPNKIYTDLLNRGQYHCHSEVLVIQDVPPMQGAILVPV